MVNNEERNKIIVKKPIRASIHFINNRKMNSLLLGSESFYYQKTLTGIEIISQLSSE